MIFGKFEYFEMLNILFGVDVKVVGLFFEFVFIVILNILISCLFFNFFFIILVVRFVMLVDCWLVKNINVLGILFLVGNIFVILLKIDVVLILWFLMEIFFLLIV